MKYIAAIFLLLGCFSFSGQSEGCEVLNSHVGAVHLQNQMNYKLNEYCRKIPVTTGKFIQLKVNNLTLKVECPDSFVKISSAENQDMICKSSNFKPLTITALSDVTVRYFLTQESKTSYEYGFHLEYIIRDIECVNKGSFNCSPTSCIPQTEVCDGIKDCENGIDEIGCERGILAISGVAEARKKAVSWLKKERLPSWGWRDYTPRGVVALYLASNATFNGKVLEEELMAKETEIKIAVALLRPSLTNCELSMFIHALLVTCHDPRDFYGNNLVKRLKKQVENSHDVSHPISYLALCNAHEIWPPKAHADLKTILKTSLEYPFVKGSHCKGAGRQQRLEVERYDSVLDERVEFSIGRFLVNLFGLAHIKREEPHGYIQSQLFR
ncbi:unnamed protein product [Larinioides sclopetarius]|uniref:Uncharacterized protein n=1 Tax=Larinioides sclopetarius TaxID=280406 RepID=A0AAV2BA34_9ARAC